MDDKSDFKTSASNEYFRKRNILNAKDLPDNLQVSTHYKDGRGAVKDYKQYATVEFAKTRSDYMSPIEDEELLNNGWKYENNQESNYYVPENDPVNNVVRGSINESDVADYNNSWFNNPRVLMVLVFILLLIAIAEAIGLILLLI